MATKRPATKQNIQRDSRGIYVLGSLAVQQAPKAEPKRQQQPQIHVVRPKKRASVQQTQVSFAAKIALTCAMLAVLACGLMLVGKYALIAQNNSMIADRKQELEDLTRYGEQLEVELAMSQDLNAVMVTAREELGMAAPQQQMRHEVVLGTPQDAPDTISAQEEAPASGIMAMLGRITEFLH
ncbi:MAG: hypothetical protein J6L88_09665 [Clostridia bacterium]|nr:hypothetical protein [Clostridia bacterium]